MDLVVADSEGLHRAGDHALHQRGDGAGIHAAGEEHSKRNVAHQAHADGLFQTLPAFVDPVGVVALLGLLGARHVPVLVNPQRARVHLQRQMVARHQLADTGEHGALTA